jgi:hypothetical protein
MRCEETRELFTYAFQGVMDEGYLQNAEPYAMIKATAVVLLSARLHEGLFLRQLHSDQNNPTQKPKRLPFSLKTEFLSQLTAFFFRIPKFH